MSLQTSFLKRLIYATEPYNVLKHRKFDPTRDEDGNHFVENPRVRGERLYFDRCEVWSEDANSAFRAGNIVDLIKYVDKTTYANAVRDFFQSYSRSFRDLSGFEKKYAIEAVTKTLSRNRKVFDLITTLLDNSDWSGLPSVRSYLRANRVLEGNVRGWCAACGHKPLMRFLKGMYEGKDIPFDLEGHGEYLVTPMWVSRGVPGRVEILRCSDSAQFVIQLRENDTQWAGLQGGGKGGCAHVFGTLTEAMTMNSFYREHGAPEHALYVHTACRTRQTESWAPDQTLYHHNSKCALGNIRQVYDVSKEFHVREFENWTPGSGVMTWGEFVSTEFLKLANEDKSMVPRVSAFLKAMDLGYEDRVELAKLLPDEGWSSRVKAEIKSDADDREFPFKTYVIRETPHGYVAIQGEHETLITNFTVSVDDNVIFQDDENVIHRGHIHTGGQKIPFHINRDDVSKWKEIEGSALRAFRDRARNATAHGKMPVVMDPSYGHALCTVVNTVTGEAGQVFGASHLGWDHDGNRFNASAWSWDQFGLNPRPPNYVNPHKVWRDWSTSPSLGLTARKTEVNTRGLRPAMTDYFLALSAQLARGYLGQSQPIIAVEDSGAARRFLKHVFVNLGQLGIISMPNPGRKINLDRVVPGFGEYPILARSTFDVADYPALNYPFTYLGPTGLSMDEWVTAKDYTDVTRVAWRVITSVLDWLVSSREEGIRLNFPYKVGDMDALAEEGRQVLLKADDELYDYLDVVRSPFIGLQLRKLMRTYGRDYLQENLRFSLQAQVCILPRPVGKRSKVKAWSFLDGYKDACKEASAQGVRTSDDGTRDPFMDATHFQQCYKAYFGRPPKLPNYEGLMSDAVLSRKADKPYDANTPMGVESVMATNN